MEADIEQILQGMHIIVGVSIITCCIIVINLFKSS